jgi:hypothetical protein
MLRQDCLMSTFACFTHRSAFRKPDDIGARIDRRRYRLRRMQILAVVATLIAGVGIASGWAIVGLSAYLAALAPLIVLSW